MWLLVAVGATEGHGSAGRYSAMLQLTNTVSGTTGNPATTALRVIGAGRRPRQPWRTWAAGPFTLTSNPTVPSNTTTHRSETHAPSAGSLATGRRAGVHYTDPGRTPMFRADDLQARLREQPFRPLRLIASEGLRYDILHPDLVLVGQRDLTIGFPAADNPRVYDRLVRVALVHLVGIEDLPPAAPAAANGQVPTAG